MQVLLSEMVEHLGKPGDLVEVKPGYARNYLFPRGKAVVVTRRNSAAVEKEKAKHKRREEKRHGVLKELAARIAEVNCTVVCKADENDRLYGSVTPAEVVKSLKISGFDVNPKSIRIPEPIKAIGVFPVQVHLETDIVAELKVWVVKE